MRFPRTLALHAQRPFLLSIVHPSSQQQVAPFSPAMIDAYFPSASQKSVTFLKRSLSPPGRPAENSTSSRFVPGAAARVVQNFAFLSPMRLSE